MEDKFCIRYHLKKFDGTEIKEEYVYRDSVQYAVGFARRKARTLSKKLSDIIHFSISGNGVYQFGWVNERKRTEP